MLGYESLSSYSNISHFVTTRQGGCSEGNYASFNCTPYSGDEAEKVRRNQTLLMEGMSQTPEELVIPVQTHETNCLLIGDAYLSASTQQRQAMLHGVDALITREPGYCLCISTADCVPVLMYDKKHSAIAAIHAGWRGTVAYIVRDTLLRMEKEFGTSGEDVVACIGPSISLALKWVRKCMKHFRRMVLICLVFLSGKRKPENIISTCGKRTGCKSLLSVCRPARWSLPGYVRIFITTSFSRQGVWALSPDGFCRGS